MASLCQAGLCGADFVEFDVQLTQDLVPVLYHDFRLKATANDTRDMTDSSSCNARDTTDSCSTDTKGKAHSDTRDTTDSDTRDTAESCSPPRKPLVKDLTLQQVRSLRQGDAMKLGVESLTNHVEEEEVDSASGRDGEAPFPTLKEVRGCGEGSPLVYICVFVLCLCEFVCLFQHLSLCVFEHL